MDVAIEPASEADEPVVVALWQACGLVVAPNDPTRDFRLARGGAASDILVAAVDDGIVGAILVGHDGHRGFVHNLACDPALRGNGIGGRLVAAAEAWLRGRGISRMHLMVRETNTTVMPFYERLGFEKMPYQVMSKWLDQG